MKTLKKILGFILCLLLIIAMVAGIWYAVLSYNGKQMAASVERLDTDGTLYSMDCTENIYSPLISLPLKVFTFDSRPACTAFAVRNEDGDAITGRNFDFPHKKADGTITGLNVLLRCEPKGKYRSICMADAALISTISKDYCEAAYDSPDTRLSFTSLMPYICMDGMNEKGLTVSILYLDLKDGEQAVHQEEPGKEKVLISYLVRYMLDSCATVSEAETLARSYNLTNLMNNDYHLFVTDADGVSAAFEWRYNELSVTYTDVVTNFYVGYGDAEDSKFFEERAYVSKEYHYGYGHGYDRFNTAVKVLDGKQSLSEAEALSLLSDVAQEYTGEATSCTQYSVVYNSTDLTVTVRSARDGSIHEFSLEE